LDQKYPEELEQMTLSLDATNKKVSEATGIIDEHTKTLEQLEVTLSSLSLDKKKYEKLADERNYYFDLAETNIGIGNMYNYAHYLNFDANCDLSDLRSSQKMSNVSGIIGNFTGVFGGLLASNLEHNINVLAGNIVQVSIELSAELNSYINNIRDAKRRILHKTRELENLVDQEISGDNLLFNLDVLKTRLQLDYLDPDRKVLVRALEEASIALEAYYNVYKLLLSVSDENADFLKNIETNLDGVRIEFSNFVHPDDILLSDAEKLSIYLSAYNHLPYITEQIMEKDGKSNVRSQELTMVDYDPRFCRRFYEDKGPYRLYAFYCDYRSSIGKIFYSGSTETFPIYADLPKGKLVFTDTGILSPDVTDTAVLEHVKNVADELGSYNSIPNTTLLKSYMQSILY
jgi:hypothetical protein